MMPDSALHLDTARMRTTCSPQKRKYSALGVPAINPDRNELGCLFPHVSPAAYSDSPLPGSDWPSPTVVGFRSD